MKVTREALEAACSTISTWSKETETETVHSVTEVYTEYTPVACIMNKIVFSQAQITYVLVVKAHELNGSGLQRHHCAHENSQSSGPPCHLFARFFHIFSLPVHHNTKHKLDSTTFSKTTLYTEHLFRDLYSRRAALTNRSRTSITSVAETREQTLPQVLE